MKIQYEKNIEDIVAFVQYQYKVDPPNWLLRFAVRWLLPIGVIIIVVLQNYQHFGWRQAPAIVLSVLYMFVLPHLLHALRPWSLRRRLRAAGDRVNLGHHSLEVTVYGLKVVNLNAESKIRWDGIHKVVAIKDYVFFYVGPMTSVIVPRETFSGGDWEEFLKYVSKCAGEEKWVA